MTPEESFLYFRIGYDSLLTDIIATNYYQAIYLEVLTRQNSVKLLLYSSWEKINQKITKRKIDHTSECVDYNYFYECKHVCMSVTN